MTEDFRSHDVGHVICLDKIYSNEHRERANMLANNCWHKCSPTRSQGLRPALCAVKCKALKIFWS